MNDGRFRGSSNFAGIGFSNTEQPIERPARCTNAASYKLNAITLQKRYRRTRNTTRIDLARASSTSPP
jgi:predicted porin